MVIQTPSFSIGLLHVDVHEISCKVQLESGVVILSDDKSAQIWHVILLTNEIRLLLFLT